MSIPSISDQPITKIPSLSSRFPIDVMANIYAFAGPRDTSTCTTLSRQSSKDALECARITIQGELKRFIEYVKVTLGDANITSQLDRIELLSAHKFPNLLSLKTAVFDIQYDILNVLRILTDNQKLSLRNIPKLTFCEDIIRMAAIRKKYLNHKSLTLQEYNELFDAGDLQRAYEIVALKENDPIFGEIFKGLLRTNGFPENPIIPCNKETLNDAIQKVSEKQLEQKNFSKAIQALNMIPDREVREKNLQELCRTLAEKGELDWAIKTTKNIRNKIVYSIAVRAICIALTKKGNVEKATSLAETLLTDPQEIAHALAAISQTLTNAELLSAAFSIAMSIKDIQARSNALYSLSENLVAKGQILQPKSLRNDSMARFGALDVASKIPNDSRRDMAYQNICKFLAEKKEFPKSIEVASLIQNPSSKDLATSAICKAMTLDGLVSSALQIAETIQQIPKRNETYLDICTSLAKEKQFQKSIEIAERIGEQQKKDKAWLTISQEMLNDNLFLEAAQIVAKIQNQRTRLEKLENIYTRLVEQKRWDQAIAVANLILEEPMRVAALEFISSWQKRG